MPPAKHRLNPALWLASLVIGGLGVAHAPAQPIRAIRPFATQPAALSAAENLRILADLAADPAARAGAARRLLAADDVEVQQQLTALLSPGAGVIETQQILLREVAAMPAAPGWAFGPLTDLLKAAEEEHRPAIVHALGSFRTREAVRLLLDCAGPSSPPALSEAAVQSLVRLTGRADLGADPAAWSAWFAQVQWLPEPEWRRVLVEGLAARADALAAEREVAMTRLVDALRRRYVDTPGLDERSAMLAGFLRDDLHPVRRLGVELINRELANARLPGPPVAAAALDLLKDPNRDFRLAAAALIDLLAPERAEPAVSAALRVETDPEVAAILLRQARRWPSASVKVVILEWLGAGPPAQRPAIDAAASLFDHGLLDDPKDQARVLAAIRNLSVVSLPPAGLAMLAKLGTSADRAAIGRLLLSENPATRLLAAQTLAPYQDGLDSVLEAARTDPGLFDSAAAAICAHAPTVPGFTTLAALPAPTPAVRTTGLVSLAQHLSAGDLLVSALEMGDLTLREAILERFASPSARSMLRPGSSSSLQDSSTVAGLLLLAQTRLDLGKPAATLDALDSLASLHAHADRTLTASLRTVALLWLNRLDDAAGLGAPADAWLDGLERAIALPHAPDIVQAIVKRFADRLTADQFDRFQALRTKVTPRGVKGPPAPNPHGGPP